MIHGFGNSWSAIFFCEMIEETQQRANAGKVAPVPKAAGEGAATIGLE